MVKTVLKKAYQKGINGPNKVVEKDQNRKIRFD